MFTCQPVIPPQTGTFAGMTLTQLIATRAQLQAALVTLAAGGKPSAVAYGSGDGTKSVTFSRTSTAEIRAMIAELNALLGNGSRRAATPLFT